jgi:DNA-binding beta-propeller fold protein YncE
MNRFFSIIALFIVFVSCNEEPVETVLFEFDTQNGVYIACEGNFMFGNSSLSFYNTKTGNVNNHLFYARNNAPLGDVAQSIEKLNNDLFVVVNNSGKIISIDAETANFKGVIRGLTSPRYIHFISDEKAYVSDLYANHISIINPKTYEIVGKIDLGNHTSEQMVQVGKQIFASSWSFDEYILVIDSKTDLLVDKIKVPFQPKELKLDKNNKIWVLSQGSTEGFSTEEISPALSRIDPITLTIEQIYQFNMDDLPSGLEINTNKDSLYFINNGINKMSIYGEHLPDSVFIKPRNLYYSLGLNPSNNEIYVSDAIDYTQNAIVYRFKENGSLLDSFKVGINPSDYLFYE